MASKIEQLVKQKYEHKSR